MPSTESPGEPVPIDREYVEIIESNVDVDNKFIDDTGIAAKIIYYCMDCKKTVKPKRIGKKFQFSCTECKGSNVAFGTTKSLANYYKIPESEL